MPRPSIPERQPVGDAFSGVVLQTGAARVLASTPNSGSEVIASGNFVVRYGVQYLGKPHLSIVPGLIALDYGEMLTGEAAWDFLLKRSNLHPRADVMGYRSDGTEDMVTVKWLDLAQPIRVLVYADDQATSPIAHVTALIAQDTEHLPQRLLQYLPHYETHTEWQATNV